MHKKDHLLQTAAYFGSDKVAEEYAWVHEWLDELADKGVELHKHRQYRHHRKALDNAFMDYIFVYHRNCNKDLAHRIAEQHIYDDLGYVPDNESEFVFRPE